MSARVRRSTDSDSAVLDSSRSRRSIAAISECSDFKALDISLINEYHFQQEKLDAFHTQSRNSRLSEDASASTAGSRTDAPNLDRGFLYGLQENILTSMRLEIQEEASRLRHFFKRAFQEAKDELLMDISTMQQGPAAMSSKILGAVWEVLEEVRESKDKLKISDVLQTIRENRQEIDLTEVTASMDDIKRRLDFARIAAPLESTKPRDDLSEVLMEVRSLRERCEAHEESVGKVLAAVPDRRPEEEVPGALAALAERHTEVLGEVQQLRASMDRMSSDLSPMFKAIDDVREAEAKMSATLAEVVALGAAPAPVPTSVVEAAVAAERAAAGVRTDVEALRGELLQATQAHSEGLRQAIQGLSAASSIDLTTVTNAIAEEKEILLEAIGGLREALPRDRVMAELVDALREESSKLSTSRAKLAEVFAAQEERRLDGEQDIRAGLEVVRDLRKTVVLDLQPVLAGLDHTEVKMARVCEQVMVKLEQHHAEMIAMMRPVGTRSGSTRRPY